MNKRSAMLVAGGLVLALLVAGMAVATGFTGPEAAANSSRVGRVKPEHQKPEIRTTTHTITVHRDAKAVQSTAAPQPVVVTQTQAPVAPATAEPAGDDGYGDDDGYEDDGYESEDHESDDHEIDDHEADDHEIDDHEGEDD